MPDMLVNLRTLDDYRAIIEALKKEGIEIFRAIAPDKFRVIDWVREHSTPSAAAECDVCFSHTPVSLFIAVKASKIIGYACYNATAPNFFGPTKVLDEYQGKGIGKALLLRSLHALRDEGYQYAIIGGVCPIPFYEKCVGAAVIESSMEHTIYNDFLGKRERLEKDPVYC